MFIEISWNSLNYCWYIININWNIKTLFEAKKINNINIFISWQHKFIICFKLSVDSTYLYFFEIYLYIYNSYNVSVHIKKHKFWIDNKVFFNRSTYPWIHNFKYQYFFLIDTSQYYATLIDWRKWKKNRLKNRMIDDRWK